MYFPDFNILNYKTLRSQNSLNRNIAVMIQLVKYIPCNGVFFTNALLGPFFKGCIMCKTSTE